MELKRIIARDSKAATDEALAKYGRDVLIVSSNRVNGLTELIVAIDVHPSQAQTTEPLNAMQSDTPMPKAAQSRPTTPSQSDADTLASAWARFDVPVMQESPEMSASKAAIRSFATALEHTQLATGRKPTAAPAAVAASSATPPIFSSNATPARPLSDPAPTLGIGAMSPYSSEERARDALRAEEIVKLLKDELQALRQEFRLAQSAHQSTSSSLAPALLPLLKQLDDLHMPAALRSKILACWSEHHDPIAALGALEALLIGLLPTAHPQVAWEGIHVISGPSGCGKTTMVSKLAMQGAAHWEAESVAWISFADHRAGAWGQTQVSAAASGVSTYRAKDGHALQVLLDELSHMQLILIDTAGVQFESQFTAIQAIAPQARLHMVLPLDATHTHVRAALGCADLGSVMLSKVDESHAPWVVLNALTQQGASVSHVNTSARTQEPLLTYAPNLIVERAMNALCQSNDAHNEGEDQPPAVVDQTVSLVASAYV